MSNKTLSILFIVIVLFLAGAVFFFTKQQNHSPRSQETANTTPTPSVFTLKETQVQLTSTGFSPRTVTIKKNEGVVWVNKSGVKATINSADHPTHKRFPEMNLGEFGNNQTLSHVFTKAGTYEYHNHYKPQETATVIVVE